LSDHKLHNNQINQAAPISPGIINNQVYTQELPTYEVVANNKQNNKQENINQQPVQQIQMNPNMNQLPMMANFNYQGHPCIFLN
jgi:hypothetical protein